MLIKENMNKEIIEEAAEKYVMSTNYMSAGSREDAISRAGFVAGVKWQLENLSKEDLIQNPLVIKIMEEFIRFKFDNGFEYEPTEIVIKKYKQSILKEEKS